MNKLVLKVERIGKKEKIIFAFVSAPFSFLVIKWRETDEDVLERIYNKESVFTWRNIFSFTILRRRLSLTQLVILRLVLITC